MAWQGSTRRTSPGDLGRQRLHPDEAHRFRHVRPSGTRSWYALLLKSHWDAAERRCHVACGLDLCQDANDQGWATSLVAVTASSNRSKSDQAPRPVAAAVGRGVLPLRRGVGRHETPLEPWGRRERGGGPAREGGRLPRSDRDL